MTAGRVRSRASATSRLVTALVVLALLQACGGDRQPETSKHASTPRGAATAPSTTPPSTARQPTAAGPTGSTTAKPQPPPKAKPSPSRPATAGPFDADRALRTVEYLAGTVGPREATSRAFARAADRVDAELRRLGLKTRRERVPVPAGNSWGVPVRKGTSENVIAEPAGFDDSEPFVVIGAHLDTVPQAPGAEDNASGVAVLLELARMISEQPPEAQVRLIAFGAEEPRGAGDALHHFGSRRHLANMTGAERGRIDAMVSLDRVGVRGRAVPVCSGGLGTTRLRAALARAAGKIPTMTCENRSSDHWSFEKAGVPAARLGSIPYRGYHSAEDVPSVVDRRQLDRVGRIVWAWLRDQ